MAVPNSEFMSINGDLNGHVGEHANGFEGIHGGYGYGTHNCDGIRIWDFCAATVGVLKMDRTFCIREKRLYFLGYFNFVDTFWGF